LYIFLILLDWWGQEAADDDDDDLDLFGDETEEDKKAAAEREAAKASSKKKESKWKSILVLLKRFMLIIIGCKLRLETKLWRIMHIHRKGLGICILTNVIGEIRKELCSIFRFTGIFPFVIWEWQLWYKFVYFLQLNHEQIWLGGKSSVLMDIKPWDDETDMKKLEAAVRSVEMPGLFWGACNSSYLFKTSPLFLGQYIIHMLADHNARVLPSLSALKLLVQYFNRNWVTKLP
jgi:EF-1 guanine nucleotide exchange domain